MARDPSDLAARSRSLFDVAGKVIIVTGASSGLGRELATGLHHLGGRVVAVGRRQALVEDLVRGLGDPATAITADVTLPADRDAIVAATTARWSCIDVLINNAGTVVEGHPDGRDEPLDAFRSVLEVNLVGLFALTQLVARQMTKAGSGSIVNIGSIFGLVAAKGGASYVASKGAVHALTRELAVQWAGDGIRVNAVAPGWFPSELTEHVFGTDEGKRMLRQTVPMARGGRSDELLGAVVYFCAAASSYCTGQTLYIDGGYTAR